MTTDPVSVTINNSPAFASEFDFVTDASDNVSIVVFVKEESNAVNMRMRRLNLYNWWPARQIQLFFIKKAFTRIKN